MGLPALSDEGHIHTQHARQLRGRVEIIAGRDDDLITSRAGVGRKACPEPRLCPHCARIVPEGGKGIVPAGGKGIEGYQLLPLPGR